jgi:imidazoleglycerol phosphate synthase cyclase subunit
MNWSFTTSPPPATTADIMLDVVSRVAEQVFIPFSVGGGLRTVEDCSRVLLAGAEKVNVNSAAVKNPGLIAEAAKAFGAQAVVLSMDVLRVEKPRQIPSGYEIVINGGRTPMGLDAIQWAKRGEELGAGELVVNSIDADGTKEGYELTLTRLIAEAVSHPGHCLRRRRQARASVRCADRRQSRCRAGGFDAALWRVYGWRDQGVSRRARVEGEDGRF